VAPPTAVVGLVIASAASATRAAEACTNPRGQVAASAKPMPAHRLNKKTRACGIAAATMPAHRLDKKTPAREIATIGSSAGELPKMPIQNDDSVAGGSPQLSAATPNHGQTVALQENIRMELAYVDNATASQHSPEGTRCAAPPEGQAESPPSTPLRKSPRIRSTLTPEKPKALAGTNRRKRKKQEAEAIEENDVEKDVRLKRAVFAPEPSSVGPSRPTLVPFPAATVPTPPVTSLSDETSAQQQLQQQWQQQAPLPVATLVTLPMPHPATANTVAVDLAAMALDVMPQRSWKTSGQRGGQTWTEVPIDHFRQRQSKSSRPQRNRLPKLEAWRGERVNYERQPGSLTPSITSVTVNLAPRPSAYHQRSLPLSMLQIPSFQATSPASPATEAMGLRASWFQVHNFTLTAASNVSVVMPSQRGKIWVWEGAVRCHIKNKPADEIQLNRGDVAALDTREASRDILVSALVDGSTNRIGGDIVARFKWISM